MLSLDFIRQHPEVVREGLRRRCDPQSIDEILHLAEQRRGLAMRCEGLYSLLKGPKELIRTAPAAQRPVINNQIKAITQDIRPLELQIADIDTRLQPLLLALPNIPHESVPEIDNQELRRWGEPLDFQFEPQTHWELGERLRIIDFEGGSKVAGSRFVILKGAGARLERALISFMLDLHIDEHGYTEIMPPHLVRRSMMVGAGQLPKFEDQVYACPDDELYLNPTAEVPLVGLHSDSILPPDTLPLRYVAWTTAFRREAGHQLELHYRVVALCTANLPFAAAKTVDLEVWMPGQGRYVEISSVSNCEAFQARRANIKYRSASNNRAEYVHTLNASGLAVGRTMAAILEAYQQANGTVVIPKVLRPYMGAALLSS